MKTLEQVADFLGISKTTMYRWCKAKKIPCSRVGKLWRFDEEEVRQWAKKEGKK